VVRDDSVQADLSVRRHSLLHTAGNVVWIARNERTQAGPLLASYALLEARELVEQVVIEELERSGKLGLVEQMAIEYHHHVEEGEDLLGDLLATLERNGFGYQLEARFGPGAAAARGRFQNVLVYAYRKRDDA
jgi:citrate lyase alpha subunit